MMRSFNFLLERPSQASIMGREGKVWGQFVYISPKILRCIVAPSLEFWKTHAGRRWFFCKCYYFVRKHRPKMGFLWVIIEKDTVRKRKAEGVLTYADDITKSLYNRKVDHMNFSRNLLLLYSLIFSRQVFICCVHFLKTHVSDVNV
jgi:hypothetical protein